MTDPRPMSRTHAIRAARVLGSVIRIETLDIDSPVLFRYESGRWQWHTPGSEMWPGWNRTTLKHLDECLRASTPGDFRTQAPNFDAEEAVREARKGGEMLPHPFTHRFPDRNRSTTDRCTTCGSRSVHPIHDADPNHPLALTDTDLAEIRAEATAHPYRPAVTGNGGPCYDCNLEASDPIHDWLTVAPGQTPTIEQRLAAAEEKDEQTPIRITVWAAPGTGTPEYWPTLTDALNRIGRLAAAGVPSSIGHEWHGNKAGAGPINEPLPSWAQLGVRCREDVEPVAQEQGDDPLAILSDVFIGASDQEEERGDLDMSDSYNVAYEIVRRLLTAIPEATRRSWYLAEYAREQQERAADAAEV